LAGSTDAPLWTILIAACRPSLKTLLDSLLPQVEQASGQVTVEALWNRGERELGRVRDDLQEHATAAYTCFVDDDDSLPDYYAARVLPLLDGEVDYIGWRMQAWADGRKLDPTRHSLRYSTWGHDSEGYYRDVSHLNPVRRVLTEGVSFCVSWPEDKAWVGQMRSRLATEHFIEDEMYYYHITSADSVQAGTVRYAASRPQVSHPYFSWHPASST
jgi:hypothetical protein